MPTGRALAACRPAADQEARLGVDRPHRRLERHFRGPQLDRVQAGECAKSGDAMTWSAGATGAHEWLGAGQPLVRQYAASFVDVHGPQATALFPKLTAPIGSIATANSATIGSGRGRTATHFIATALRAVPELQAPAVQRDRQGFPRPIPYAGLPTAAPGSKPLFGLLGFKARMGGGHRAQFPHPRCRSSTCGTRR